MEQETTWLKKKYRSRPTTKSTPYASRTGNRSGSSAGASRLARKAKHKARARYLKSNQKVQRG